MLLLLLTVTVVDAVDGDVCVGDVVDADVVAVVDGKRC